MIAFVDVSLIFAFALAAHIRSREEIYDYDEKLLPTWLPQLYLSSFFIPRVDNVSMRIYTRSHRSLNIIIMDSKVKRRKKSWGTFITSRHILLLECSSQFFIRSSTFQCWVEETHTNSWSSSIDACFWCERMVLLLQLWFESFVSFNQSRRHFILLFMMKTEVFCHKSQFRYVLDISVLLNNALS